MIEPRYEKGGEGRAAVSVTGTRSATASWSDEPRRDARARVQAWARIAASGRRTPDDRSPDGGGVIPREHSASAGSVFGRGLGRGASGPASAGSKEETDASARGTNRRDGLWPTTQGPCSVVGAPDCQGDGASADRQAGWSRNDSGDFGGPRLEAVAEKKCGAFRRSTRSS